MRAIGLVLYHNWSPSYFYGSPSTCGEILSNMVAERVIQINRHDDHIGSPSVPYIGRVVYSCLMCDPLFENSNSLLEYVYDII